jgi:sulfite exporter TauE/SafE
MQTELFTLLLASLAGSWHCAGMCGPFAMLISPADQGRLLLYQLGRLMTYSLMVAVLHTFAQSLPRAWGQGLFAAVMILWIVMLAVPLLKNAGLPASITSHLQIRAPKLWMQQMRKLAGWGLRLNPRLGAFMVGMTTSSIPCLWLYGFTTIAGAQSNLKMGLIYITVFWLGTLPVLWLSHVALHKVSLKTRLYSRRLSLGLILFVGAFSYWTHKGIWAPEPTSCHDASTTETTPTVQEQGQHHGAHHAHH